eukprot:CAMPEP_0119272816 /NCGR_PEP_ID=MMETSP1329-20130426/9094_1 /TAXON_ID=114041 /ORGANISM="Genus nov. species nov., Strain RCC1024" /LENGTH=313 /DNA_ID=CAMNT_0007272925 /DNA_START=138 /DNA_END=1076 /DNA_ORIENTATION=+
MEEAKSPNSATESFVLLDGDTKTSIVDHKTSSATADATRAAVVSTATDGAETAAAVDGAKTAAPPADWEQQLAEARNAWPEHSLYVRSTRAKAALQDASARAAAKVQEASQRATTKVTTTTASWFARVPRWLLWALVASVAFAAAFAGGYRAGANAVPKEAAPAKQQWQGLADKLRQHELAAEAPAATPAAARGESPTSEPTSPSACRPRLFEGSAPARRVARADPLERFLAEQFAAPWPFHEIVSASMAVDPLVALQMPVRRPALRAPVRRPARRFHFAFLEPEQDRAPAQAPPAQVPPPAKTAPAQVPPQA